MNNEYETRLLNIINSTSPDARARVSEDIQHLKQSNISSFEGLMFVVQDESSDLETRKIACWLLGRFHKKRAATALLTAFSSEDDKLLWESAKSIGMLQSKRSVEPLIKFLLTSTSVNKRSAAAYALGYIGVEQAVEPLTNVLHNKDEDPIVRGYAAEALALLKDERAVVPLITSLNDENPEIRFWSAYALGEIGDERALPALQHIAETDTIVLPRWGAVKAEADEAIASIKAKALSS